MLKVTKQYETATEVVLRVEGRIVAEHVAELERECRAAIGAGRRVVLDLAAVSYVDSAGADLLGGLPPASRAYVNCSEFLENLLWGECG